MNLIRLVFISGVVVIAATGSFVYSGVYPIGADVPHSQLIYKVSETLRERSIARVAADLEFPNLDNSELLLSGGTDYNEMCASCQLRPEQSQSDMSIGLYPAPPNLSRPHAEDTEDHDHGDKAQAVRRQFWIIKHGIKASVMPAWRATHDDVPFHH